jgi:hypothetical protein
MLRAPRICDLAPMVLYHYLVYQSCPKQSIPPIKVLPDSLKALAYPSGAPKDTSPV